MRKQGKKNTAWGKETEKKKRGSEEESKELRMLQIRGRKKERHKLPSVRRDKPTTDQE